MSLFLDHGLRVGEVAILKRNQIALRSRLLTFYRPEVDKPQIDRLTDDTLVAARAYLPTLPAKQESLFDLAVISIQERVRTLGELVACMACHRMIVGIPGRPGQPGTERRLSDSSKPVDGVTYKRRCATLKRVRLQTRG